MEENRKKNIKKNTHILIGYRKKERKKKIIKKKKNLTKNTSPVLIALQKTEDKEIDKEKEKQIEPHKHC